MLVICSPNCEAMILWSCQGIMQGDPLSMILYVIALVLLVKILEACPEVMQPWYADDLALLT